MEKSIYLLSNDAVSGENETEEGKMLKDFLARIASFQPPPPHVLQN